MYRSMASEDLSVFVNGEPLHSSAVIRYESVEIQPEDTSRKITVNLCKFREPAFEFSTWVIFWRRTQIASSVRVWSSLAEVQFAKFDAIATQTPQGQSELWPHTHAYLPNSGIERAKDKTAQLEELLACLEKDAGVRVPPADHKKIGHKTRDIFDLSQLHVDRFSGMRHGRAQVRRRISRTFLNLGVWPRTSAFALMNPDLIDRFVPDLYSNRYLDDLYDACGLTLDLFVPHSPERLGPVISGVRYLATHLLHCEFGKAGDLVAVVNSDTELLRETLP